jgi:hypothetical protein
MNHKKGDIKWFNFTDKICSADLHGFRVYVLCSDEKNRDLNRVYYGPDIMTPRWLHDTTWWHDMISWRHIVALFHILGLILVLIKFCFAFLPKATYFIEGGGGDTMAWAHGMGWSWTPLKFHLGPPCPTFERLTNGPPLKRPHDRFRGDLLAEWVACGRLPPLWTSHAVRLWRI